MRAIPSAAPTGRRCRPRPCRPRRSKRHPFQLRRRPPHPRVPPRRRASRRRVPHRRSQRRKPTPSPRLLLPRNPPPPKPPATTRSTRSVQGRWSVRQLATPADTRRRSSHGGSCRARGRWLPGRGARYGRNTKPAPRPMRQHRPSVIPRGAVRSRAPSILACLKRLVIPAPTRAAQTLVPPHEPKEPGAPGE